MSTEKQFKRDSSPAASQGMLHQADLAIREFNFWTGWCASSTAPSPQSGNAASSKNFRRPLSRARTSEGILEPLSNSPKSKPNQNSPTIPFFDKENPARFLALLKGVSKRVDENAGVRRYDLARPSAPIHDIANLKRKRPQPTRVGSSSDAKRLRPCGEEPGDNGRKYELPYLKVQHLRGYQSVPDVTSEDVIPKELQDGPHDLPQFSPTFSHPLSKQKPAFDDTGSGLPKLHPLLQKASSEPSSMTPTPNKHAMTMGTANSTPVTVESRLRNTLSPESGTSSRTSTPCAAGKGSVRRPVLGMRRTRTMVAQTRTPPDLPTRQKAFKPPLLSNRSQQSEMDWNQ